MSETKYCNKCGRTLPRTEFSKDSSKKDGLRSYCKACAKEQQKAWREKNPEKVREYHKAYREENREKRRECKKAHYENNREKYLEYQKARRENNPEKERERHKSYREKNPEKVREQQKAYRKKRLRTDPLFALQLTLRSRTRAAFKNKGFKKGTKTQRMLGCSWEMLKDHIESQFSKGMTWANRGEWHVDHIVPLASGRTVEELEKLAHFSNLRPMWAGDNMAKGDKIIECQPELTLSHL